MAAFEDPCEHGFDPDLVKTALMSREQFSSKPRKLILGIDMGIAGVEEICVGIERICEFLLRLPRPVDFESKGVHLFLFTDKL